MIPFILYSEPPATSKLSHFSELTTKDVLYLINSSPIKSFGSDLVPASVFKGCLPQLLPVIPEIVNLSLSSSEVLSQLKATELTPLLKKHNLDPDLLPAHPLAPSCSPSPPFPYYQEILLGDYDVNFHSYVNDTQFCLMCPKPAWPSALCDTLPHLKACITDIRRNQKSEIRNQKVDASH